MRARVWLVGWGRWSWRDASSAFLLVAVLLIVTLSAVYFVRQRSALIGGVDGRLRTAAEAALELNGGGPVDEHLAAGSIDPGSYLEDARRNYAFASRAGLAYVYGLVLDGSTPRFVFDTAAPGAVGAKEVTSPFEAYGSAPPAVLRAFRTGEPQFVEYTDRWGTFRSIFLPARTPAGVPYVVGADIRFSDVQALLRRLLLETLLIGGLAILATLAFALGRRRALSQSRKQLAASEGRARRIVDAIPDLVLVLDRSEVIVDCHSDDLDAELALPSEALIGRRVADVLGEPVGQLLHDAAGRARATASVESVDYELLLGSGSLTYEARVVAIDEHAVLVLTRDVTERTELQRSLAEQNEELKALDRMKDEFLALVSHELRTPLTSILGYVEMLLEEPTLDPEHHQFLGVVDRNAQRLLRLVGDLLLLAHLESGRLDLTRATTDLAAVAATAVESQQPRAAAAGVEVALAIDPIPPIQADRARLDQLTDNLLSNAIKYTPPGGRVTVRVGQTPDGGALLEVSDTGIGIPEREQQQLFERFFRASTATERQIPGTASASRSPRPSPRPTAAASASPAPTATAPPSPSRSPPPNHQQSPHRSPGSPEHPARPGPRPHGRFSRRPGLRRGARWHSAAEPGRTVDASGPHDLDAATAGRSAGITRLNRSSGRTLAARSSSHVGLTRPARSTFRTRRDNRQSARLTNAAVAGWEVRPRTVAWPSPARARLAQADRSARWPSSVGADRLLSERLRPHRARQGRSISVDRRIGIL